MKKGTARTLRAFVIELAIYAVLVITYFFLVLNLLGQWLYELEIHRQILDQTSDASYDLVLVGARWTGATGHYWRSERTYEVIKAIQPPVLVAIGERKQLKRFLVCTGGKEFIEQAVQLTGEIAAALGGSVTLLHVMAEPPAIYVNLVRLEDNVDLLLESKSELGINLLRGKKSWNALASRPKCAFDTAS